MGMENKMIRNKTSSSRKGFSLIEILIAIGIIGIMAIAFYPNIMNTLETRELENAARDVMTNLQRTKFQAVKTRLNHRLRFSNESYGWAYFIEREDNPGVWNTMPGFGLKTIPSKFNVAVNFPIVVVKGKSCPTVQFSPLGFISNYDISLNSMTVQSEKLENQNKPDLRVISVFIGGAVQYVKTQSE